MSKEEILDECCAGRRAHEAIMAAMDKYAKEIAIGFIHYTEWKMKDDDWLDKKGKVKSLDQVYEEYIKKL